MHILKKGLLHRNADRTTVVAVDFLPRRVNKVAFLLDDPKGETVVLIN